MVLSQVQPVPGGGGVGSGKLGTPGSEANDGGCAATGLASASRTRIGRLRARTSQPGYLVYTASCRAPVTTVYLHHAPCGAIPPPPWAWPGVAVPTAPHVGISTSSAMALTNEKSQVT